MNEQGTKRKRRTPEERATMLDEKIEALQQSITKYEEQKNAAIQEFDDKITAVKAKIETLEQQKRDILTSKPSKVRKPRKTKKQKTEEVIRKALKSGLNLDEIAERLGVDIES